jgi:hypothetical protein
MSIKPDIRAALESARTVSSDKRPHRFGLIRSIVLAVVRELPDDMTISTLRDELEIGNAQGSDDHE